jgi:hypothetical protein
VFFVDEFTSQDVLFLAEIAGLGVGGVGNVSIDEFLDGGTPFYEEKKPSSFSISNMYSFILRTCSSIVLT